MEGLLSSQSFEVELEPRLEDLRVIHDGLRAFTDAYAGPVNARPLAIFVRDAAGNVVGAWTGNSDGRGSSSRTSGSRSRSVGAASGAHSLLERSRSRVSTAGRPCISTRWSFRRSRSTSIVDTRSMGC
jgi:hypothetical protein